MINSNSKLKRGALLFACLAVCAVNKLSVQMYPYCTEYCTVDKFPCHYADTDTEADTANKKNVPLKRFMALNRCRLVVVAQIVLSFPGEDLTVLFWLP
jgi:hypothetical protein